MSVSRIAGRYAKSLIDLAQEKGKLEAVLGDMNAFREATQNRELYLMLKSPIINASKKRNVIKALFGDSFDEMTMAFTNIILTKGREEFLPEICDEFVQQYKSIQKIASATVTSAVALGEDTLAKVKQKILNEMAQGSSDVEITTKVDPALIGGFVIELGDKLYDASVAHKLQQMKKEFS